MFGETTRAHSPTVLATARGSRRMSERTDIIASMLAFYSDSNPDLIFDCVGFDEPWNGWSTPIVSWETVLDLLQDAEWMVRTEGAVIYAASDSQAHHDEIVVLKPDDSDGLYHLRDLGWTLMESPTYDTKVLPFERPKT